MKVAEPSYMANLDYRVLPALNFFHFVTILLTTTFNTPNY